MSVLTVDTNGIKIESEPSKLRIEVFFGRVARALCVQYPGAIYQLLSHGDLREAIFRGDADRRHFLVVTNIIPEGDHNLDNCVECQVEGQPKPPPTSNAKQISFLLF